MIIPNNAYSLSSMVVQSNMNYLEAENGCALPATSAMAATDGAVEPNLLQKRISLSQKDLSRNMMQQYFIPNPSISSSEDVFGWGDFPLLQQSMVAVVPSEGVHDCSRFASNHLSEPLSFPHESCELFTSSASFDTISPASSSVSLCSTDVSSQDSSPCQRRVQFDKVQIREYALTLGDHPWCENGFPLSLDWKFAAQSDINIDDYEHHRLSESDCADRSPRKLDVWERRNLLRRVSGFSTSDLNGLERIRMLQQQRESLMVCRDETDDSEVVACSEPRASDATTSRLLRHSTTLQNLSLACV